MAAIMWRGWNLAALAMQTASTCLRTFL